MVYNGKPYWNRWFGGTTICGNTHIYTYISSDFSRHSNHFWSHKFPFAKWLTTEPTASWGALWIDRLEIAILRWGKPRDVPFGANKNDLGTKKQQKTGQTWRNVKISLLRSSRICFFELESIAIRAPKHFERRLTERIPRWWRAVLDLYEWSPWRVFVQFMATLSLRHRRWWRMFSWSPSTKTFLVRKTSQ